MAARQALFLPFADARGLPSSMVASLQYPGEELRLYVHSSCWPESGSTSGGSSL